jgi:hypothetical protein
MEPEVVKAEMVLAPTLAFKKVQTADKYPKGQSRGRQWKHLRYLLQSADASSMPPDKPNCERRRHPSSLIIYLFEDLFSVIAHPSRVCALSLEGHPFPSRYCLLLYKA